MAKVSRAYFGQHLLTEGVQLSLETFVHDDTLVSARLSSLLIHLRRYAD